MPTELEELVEFLHHGNTQIRQLAAENLVGYSTAQPVLFKRNQLEPIKDLKLLQRDYPPIAHNALTMLVNLSSDGEELANLAEDAEFLDAVVRRVVDPNDPTADFHCMLLANLAKSPAITKLLTLSLPTTSSAPKLALDALLDRFVATPANSQAANYDYLSYLFADLAKLPEGTAHFLTPHAEGSDGESIVPLSKITVFTTQTLPTPTAAIRRRGVASVIKNLCFDVPSHEKLLAPAAEGGAEILPALLLPLMGDETYPASEMEEMLEECQLLPPDKEREAQSDVMVIHLESLLLLTTTAAGRKRLWDVGVYFILREVHAHVEDEGVREGCDRVVQVLMRDGELNPEAAEEERVERERAERKAALEERVVEVEGDEDEEIVEVL